MGPTCTAKLCARHFRAVTITGSHLTGKELRAREGDPVVQRHAAASEWRIQDWSPASGTGGHAGSLFLCLHPEFPAPTSPSRADGECGLCFSLVLTPASPSTPFAQLPLLRQAVKSLPVSPATGSSLQPTSGRWDSTLPQTRCSGAEGLGGDCR